ncbi:MAG: hypothetical protein COS14_11475 [Bacteroidetes bacterium CG02_land_8_20_14_3_00_31_25]|nr:MAG: hypothetical protein COS14_11475 [Bacteroidetes bacterium CG02_land_8_20_14_3_00_31_25]
MSNDIIFAFILGLIGGVIPGPVLAATFTEILQSGFLKSLRIIIWAFLVETTVALSACCYYLRLIYTKIFSE